MLRAITIDDEFSSHQLLKRFIEEEGRVEVVCQFADPLSLLEQVGEINPDVAFVDIEMPVMSGLELAERMLSICPDIEIVFVTAFSHYAVEAFHINALDYLLKPVDSREMKRVIDKLSNAISLKALTVSSELVELTNPCRIFCLGDFEVYGPTSERKVQWLTSKVEELLAYLIMLPGKRVNKGELCEALWPDSDYEKALMNLYTTVYRLRKTIGTEGIPLPVKSDKDGYQIEIEGCIVDYKEFERLAKLLGDSGKDELSANRIEDLLEGARLYRGALFSEKAYIWCASYSEALNQDYKRLCYRLAEHFIAQSELDKSAEHLKNLMTRFPDEEKACMMLMDIYEAQNNKAAMERLYHAYIDYLATEINATPSSEFIQRYEALL